MRLRPVTGRAEDRDTRTPEVTLVLVHHAGGSAATFLPFVPYLPVGLRVLAAELPGRVTSPGDPPVTDLHDAVLRLVDALRRTLVGRYAIFGHCLGAILAFEAARLLTGESAGPVWLGVSGSLPPPMAGRPENHPGTVPWTEERLRAEVAGSGGVPPAMWRNRVLAERILRTLRNDLLLAESYRYTRDEPLAAPMSTFCGTGDARLPPGQILGWAEQTTAATSHHCWPGSHFYLFDQPREVCRQILRDIDLATALAEPGVTTVCPDPKERR